MHAAAVVGMLSSMASPAGQQLALCLGLRDELMTDAAAQGNLESLTHSSEPLPLHTHRHPGSPPRAPAGRSGWYTDVLLL